MSPSKHWKFANKLAFANFVCVYTAEGVFLGEYELFMASCCHFPTEVTRRPANDTLYTSVTHWPCSCHRLGQNGSAHSCFSRFSKVFLFQNRQQILQNWTEGKSANKDCRPQNCICRHLREKLHKGLLSLTVHQNLWLEQLVTLLWWNLPFFCSSLALDNTSRAFLLLPVTCWPMNAAITSHLQTTMKNTKSINSLPPTNISDKNRPISDQIQEHYMQA